MLNKISLKNKLNLIVAVGIILLVSVILFTVREIVTNKVLMYKVKNDLAVTSKILDDKFPGSWKVYDDGLYKGPVKINNQSEIINYIPKLTGGSAAIFAGQEKVATSSSVKKEAELSAEVVKTVLKEGKNYYTESQVESNKYLAYTPIKNHNGEIVGVWQLGVSESLVIELVGKIFFWVVIVTVIMVGIIQLILYFTMEKLFFSPLYEVIEQTKKIAAGNLNKIITLNREDEIGDLKSAINRMREKLQQIIEEISNSADDISLSSENLTSVSQETTNSIDQVSSTAGNFNEKVEEVTAKTQGIAEKTDEVNNLAAEGLNQMRITQEEMNEVINTADKTAEISTELEIASTKIRNIVEVVAEIAEQTNLLALNASIEAARAGTGAENQASGQGFAVVAEEIRELAEETQDSVVEIESVIDDISGTTSKITSRIKENNQQIETAVKDLNKTEDYFEEIVTEIKEVDNQVQKVARYSQELLTGSKEISEATEEQSLSMQEISALSKELKELVEKLEGLSGQFEI